MSSDREEIRVLQSILAHERTHFAEERAAWIEERRELVQTIAHLGKHGSPPPQAWAYEGVDTTDVDEPDLVRITAPGPYLEPEVETPDLVTADEPGGGF